jgi:hypothetical protein
MVESCASIGPQCHDHHLRRRRERDGERARRGLFPGFLHVKEDGAWQLFSSLIIPLDIVSLDWLRRACVEKQILAHTDMEMGDDRTSII